MVVRAADAAVRAGGQAGAGPDFVPCVLDGGVRPVSAVSGAAVLVVLVKPDARRVVARWGDRFPELVGAVVLSPRQPWAAAEGIRVGTLFVDQEVLVGISRQSRDLLHRLNSSIQRCGGDREVRVLPRLAENPVMLRDLADVMFGRV